MIHYLRKSLSRLILITCLLCIQLLQFGCGGRKMEPPAESPTEKPPAPKVSYRFKKNDTLLVKVKDHIYFAKVVENTKTTAKEVLVKFFIDEVALIAGNRVLLNAIQDKREKPKNGWGNQKVVIEYYDGSEWKLTFDVLVFEDFYLLPESIEGERKIGLDKVRIPIFKTQEIE